MFTIIGIEFSLKKSMQHFWKFYVLGLIKSAKKTILGFTNITFTFAENQKPWLHDFLIKNKII